MVDYQFTLPDMVMIVGAVAVVVALFVHRPQQSHLPYKSLCFKLGINAIRLAWSGGAGQRKDSHELKIQLNRLGDIFPTVGDVLTFVETDSTTWRGKVETIKLFQERRVTDNPKSKPSAIITVVEKW